MSKSKQTKSREAILEDENKKLKRTIKDKDRVIREKDKIINKLKGEVKTASDAFLTTNHHYREINNGKSLSEALAEAKGGKALPNGATCSRCKMKNTDKLLFTGFRIVLCNTCGHRERIDEVKS